MKNIIKFCTIILVLFTNCIFPQDLNSSENDTLLLAQEKQSEYKLKLNSDYQIISPLLSNKYYWDEINNFDFYIPAFQENTISEMKSNLKLREDINKALLVYRQGLNKNDLGVFGEILGYTNAAAALGLAAYHVYKYRDKYGIK